MPSDYTESSVIRKDFRRSKVDPQIAKPKGKHNSKKKYKVVIKDHTWRFIIEDEREPCDWTIGKYITLKSAEQALKANLQNTYYKEFKIVIEEI